MHNAAAKRAVLQALQPAPDFSHLASLPSPQSTQGRQLLRWLDQSGLALPFLNSVQSANQPRHSERSPRSEESLFSSHPSHPSSPLSSDWHVVLNERMERNSSRFLDMLDEFRRLNTAFRTRNVFAITLKGFSLTPDFCQNPLLRHQSDFDLLVDPSVVPLAAEVLHSLGYSTPRLSFSDESCFTTPLTRIPSFRDDLYALQHHRQVDLHVSLVESSPWLNPQLPTDCSSHAVPMTILDVHFFALSLPDRFLTQVLHAFRHASRSWLRLSWLLEIAHCLELHRENESLWRSVIERAGNGLLTRRAFALTLSLCNRLYQCPIPSHLHSWFADSITPSLRAWLDHFSMNWALADWPGNLTNLLLAGDFISDARLRHRYIASRLLPNQAQLSIAPSSLPRKTKSPAWRFHQWQYLFLRSSAHLKDVFRLPLQQLRWRRALAVSQPGFTSLHS